jgi:mannose-6-phosphate isomerase-like protein (cupin superfamily)
MKADFLHHLHALPLPPSGDYPHGTPFIQALTHDNLSVELYRPAASKLGQDIQQPHKQDELYVVQRGHSAFWLQDQRFDVTMGDVLFVPAGTPHRFEHFTDDFVTWVVFCGPQGGERA